MTAPEYLPGTDRVTIIKAPEATRGRYNASSRDWTDAERVEVYGCAVQPLRFDEDTVDREWASSRLSLWLPASTPHNPTDLREIDRVEWYGETFDVDAPPALWRDDLGQPHHISAVLKRMTG